MSAQALILETMTTPTPASAPARLSLLSRPAPTELWELSARWLTLARLAEKSAVNAISRCTPTSGENSEILPTTLGA